MYRLKAEILPCFVPVFADKKEESRNYNLDSFTKLTTNVYISIRTRFLEMLEEREFYRLEAMVRLIFMGYVVSNFNNALGLNHPFITVVAYDTEQDEYQLFTSSRKFISSRVGYITRNSVPIIYGETEKDLAAGYITGIKIIASPEDLLDILPSS